LLFALAQAVSLILVERANWRHGRAAVATNLAGSELVFRRLIERERVPLERAALQFAADAEFARAVSEADGARTAEMLARGLATLGAQRAVLIERSGRVLADSQLAGRAQAPFEHVHVLALAQAFGQGSEFVQLADGTLASVVVATVRSTAAPRWVAFTVVRDHVWLADLRALVGPQLSLVAGTPQAGWRLVDSTLEGNYRRAFAERIERRGIGGATAGIGELQLAGESFEARTVTLDTTGEVKLLVVLAQPLEPLLLPFHELSALLGAIAIGALFFTLAASALTAWQVTGPLRRLRRAVNSFRDQADLADEAPVAVDTGSPGEVGDLARAFVEMRDAVRRQQVEISRLAFQDTLTHLPNRTFLQDYLREWVAREPAVLAVCILDVNNFRRVNDTLGHWAGDALMVEVGRRLVAHAQGRHLVARVAADAFCIVLNGMGRSDVTGYMDAVVALMEAPASVDQQPIDLLVTLAAAFYPEHGDTADQLLQRADLGVAQARRRQAAHAVFDPHDHIGHRGTLSLLGRLKRAAEEGDLVLAVQPQVSLVTHEVRAVECLLRWRQPDNTMTSPGEFIPFAEETGYIRTITRKVIGDALKLSAEWERLGHNIRVAVNISSRDLQDEQLPEYIASALAQHAVAPRQLLLEITESALMEAPRLAIASAGRLAQAGVALAVDDFGTGYSSLAYLTQLPLAELKIDQVFVRGLCDHAPDAAIVRSTVELGRSLGLHVVAEGVESREQLDVLARMRCDVAQGYWISRPLLPEAFLDWLTQWQASAPGVLPA
jgi:diguanylate cyclase (GGDEF)-like protein